MCILANKVTKKDLPNIIFNIRQILSRYHGNILLRFTLIIPVNTVWQTVFFRAGVFRSQYDQIQEKTTEEETNKLLSRVKTKCQNIGLCLYHRTVSHCQAREQRHYVPTAKCSCNDYLYDLQCTNYSTISLNYVKSSLGV